MDHNYNIKSGRQSMQSFRVALNTGTSALNAYEIR
jgi:hypothetical protein